MRFSLKVISSEQRRLLELGRLLKLAFLFCPISGTRKIERRWK